MEGCYEISCHSVTAVVINNIIITNCHKHTQIFIWLSLLGDFLLVARVVMWIWVFFKKKKKGGGGPRNDHGRNTHTLINLSLHVFFNLNSAAVHSWHWSDLMAKGKMCMVFHMYSGVKSFFGAQSVILFKVCPISGNGNGTASLGHC